MAPNVVGRALGCATLLAALAVPAMTRADGGTSPPDIMPHPLVGYEPLATNGPLAFTKEKAEFIRQIAHLAQKSGYRVLDQRIYYCPTPKNMPDDIGYPPWEGINMSTSGAIFDRFGKAFDRIKEASEPISVMFQIHTHTPGYVLLSYYHFRQPGVGALIANTVLGKT